MGTFQFQPRWKEELVVTGPGGKFVLELPMGVLSAYLPTQTKWKEKAPQWSREMWPVLRLELEAWCKLNGAQFFVEESADVYAEP